MHTPPPSMNMPAITSKTFYHIEGACLQCGSYDHWLIDCPKPAWPSSQANTQLAGTGKKVLITAINNSSSYGSVDSHGFLIDNGSCYNSCNSLRE